MVPTSAPHWLAWDGPCHWREACKGSGAGGVPKNRPQCNCSWTLGTLSRPPCPLFRRENFLDAHHATVHRAILAPRGGPRKILRRHSRQAGTRWECSRVLGALPRSPATPQVSPRWWKGLPCASHPAHAVPRCPSFIQQRQPQRSPCSEAESVASQKTALPALWNSPLGSAVGSHFSGAPGTIFFKRPPGGARQPARPGDGPGPLDTTTPGSHSNSVSRLSIRGWPGGPGTPSTELPGRPGLISASKGGLSHFLGGTPNDLAPRGTVVGLGTVTGLGAVTQPSPRASRAISVQSPPPKRA